MRKELLLFTEVMEHKLRLNDHKGGWENTSINELFGLLHKEVEELNHAIMRGEGTMAVMMEAADIANFAMMISWNAGREVIGGGVSQITATNWEFAKKHHDPDNAGCPLTRTGKCGCIPF